MNSVISFEYRKNYCYIWIFPKRFKISCTCMIVFLCKCFNCFSKKYLFSPVKGSHFSYCFFLTVKLPMMLQTLIQIYFSRKLLQKLRSSGDKQSLLQVATKNKLLSLRRCCCCCYIYLYELSDISSCSRLKRPNVY